MKDLHQIQTPKPAPEPAIESAPKPATDLKVFDTPKPAKGKIKHRKYPLKLREKILYCK